MRNVLSIAVLCFVLMGVVPVGAATVTLATFQDPTLDSSTPLFIFAKNNGSVGVTGGWSGSNLDLYCPVTTTTYADATFTLSPGLAYTGTLAGGGTTGSGWVKFFAAGDTQQTSPVFIINFASCRITVDSLAGRNNFLNINDGVTFGGSELAKPAYSGSVWSRQAFSFAFTNFFEPTVDSYTVTSAFTSSALKEIAPEPATMSIFGIGILSLVSVRKKP